MNTHSDKAILITGATGFLGSYLLRYLVREGFTNIRCVRQKDSLMDLVLEVEDKVEWVDGDLTDIVFMEEVLEGIQQVYHCAGLISFHGRDRSKLLQINNEASKTLADLALYTGVEKLLHVSSVAALGRMDKKEVSEVNEWEWNDKVSNYAISKFFGEREIWRAHAEGLPVAVVNPSIVLGAGFWDEGWLQLFKNAWDERPFYPMGVSGFVDVRDVAKILIKLMNSDIDGQRFILSAENLSYRELANQMAGHFNKKPPHIAMTPWLRESIWRLSRLTGNKALTSKEVLRHFSRNYFYQNQKSTKELSIQYIPVAETIAESCTCFLESIKNNTPCVLPLT